MKTAKKDTAFRGVLWKINSELALLHADQSGAGNSHQSNNNAEDVAGGGSGILCGGLCFVEVNGEGSDAVLRMVAAVIHSQLQVVGTGIAQRQVHGDGGNLNQLGEAAGVAAYVSLQQDQPLQQLDGKRVRTILRDGGSAL